MREGWRIGLEEVGGGVFEPLEDEFEVEVHEDRE